MLTAVLPRHALGNRAENFVHIGICQHGVLMGIHAQTVLGAQQDDFVTYGNSGQAGYIRQRQIHGNTAYDGGIVLAHDHLSAR